jgi:hypothetical protein
MNEKLDFSLPDKKQKSSFMPQLLLVILIVLAGLTIFNIILSLQKQNIKPTGSSIMTAGQVKELAEKLSSRNLYTRAAKAWQDYLSSNVLTDTERAKTLYQVGTLFEKSGSYEEAIEYFYRSEMTAKLNDLESQINSHIKDCYEKLNMYSSLRYELMDRTNFKTSEQSGSKIVAEIGTEKITEADLDALIEQTINNQLSSVSMLMTADQLSRQKNKMLEQFKTAEAKTQFIQSWIAQEVLYRQAIEQGLMDQQDTKKLIKDMTREALSQQLMNKEIASKVNVTETDIQTYYQANKSKYTQPSDANDPNSPAVQKSYEQVKNQVAGELVGKKSQDVQTAFIKQMMEKYNVIIHSSAINPTKEATSQDKKQ